jgi:hypothetical protein
LINDGVGDIALSSTPTRKLLALWAINRPAPCPSPWTGHWNLTAGCIAVYAPSIRLNRHSRAGYEQSTKLVIDFWPRQFYVVSDS